MTALNAHVTGRDDWTTGTFQILTVDGAIDVAGSVRLWFGIHPRSDGWWRLSHLPTGMGIGEALSEGNLVRAVADIKDLLDWNFSDPMGIARQHAGSILRVALMRHGAKLRPDQAQFTAEAA